MFTARDIDLGILPPISFELSAGQCLVVMGPSGCGKTLLLRALADLDPRPGQVSLRGQACAQMPAPEWRARVRYCGAEPAWWLDRVAPHFQHPGQVPVESLGLPPQIMERDIARLSTGERQRLGLLRALQDSPPVLLLDEPTAALDPQRAELVECLLLDLRHAGHVLVVVTHSAQQARTLGSHILLMDPVALQARVLEVGAWITSL